jgi:hypothetical protein
MVADTIETQAGRLAELRSSAKGWHGVQIAVLGFIGLCGVLQSPSAGEPKWVQSYALVLVLVALALALVATWLVGRAAWPLYGADERGVETIAATGRRLRRGVALTFASVALTALAAASGWWPVDTGETATTVELRSGDQAWCGTLESGPPGGVTVRTGGGRVSVSLADLTALEPVSACG